MMAGNPAQAAKAARRLQTRREAMLKIMTIDELDQVVLHPLPAGLPRGFVAEQILYRQIYTPDLGFQGAYNINDKPRPLNTAHYNGIEDFAKKMAAGNYYQWIPDREEAPPLDIAVTRPSYIVLRLSPDEGNWSFAAAGQYKAVMMGDPPTLSHLYGGLTYVTANNTTTVPTPDCPVVYFAAMPQAGNAFYTQKLCYNIAVGNGYNNTMDPDVRHPGVGSG
jgi:hypothetical protein